MATTFSDPTTNPSGTPPTSGVATAGDTATGPGPTEGDSGSGATSTAGPPATSTASEADSGPEPVDEQPQNGMYSECVSTDECIGLTACVLVPGSPVGFCSQTGCLDATMQCEANPGATSSATPTCVDDGTNTGVSVCALTCEAGATCPGGMSCLPLGVTSVCV